MFRGVLKLLSTPLSIHISTYMYMYLPLPSHAHTPLLPHTHHTSPPPITHTHTHLSLTHTLQSREPFQVPVSVSWPQLSEALNCYFHAQTGRGLTPQNLDYLGRKLLGISPEEDLSQKVVTRQQVCKVRHSALTISDS